MKKCSHHNIEGNDQAQKNQKINTLLFIFIHVVLYRVEESMHVVLVKWFQFYYFLYIYKNCQTRSLLIYDKSIAR